MCPAELFGAKLIKKTHPVDGMSSDPCVESGIGMWHDKIYHFKPDKEPSSGGDEIHSEFFVGIKDFPKALNVLYQVSPFFKDFVQVTELRPVAADDIPLSPAYGRDVMAIHFTWKHDFDNVMRAVEVIKVVLKPFDFRVHWGKYFGNIEPDYLKKIYSEELDGLTSLIESYGTENKFMNCFVDKLLYHRKPEPYTKCKFPN